MSTNIDILTGNVIGELESGSKFTHSLWISTDDSFILSKCPFFSIFDIHLQDGSKASPLKITQSNKTTRFYNITQFSHAWHIFNYYLYHRQFSERNVPYAFKDQVMLHSYANKCGFRQNYWITNQFLWLDLQSKYWLKRGAKALRVRSPLLALTRYEFVYNIQRTNDSCAVRKHIISPARRLVSNRCVLSHAGESLCHASKKTELKPGQCMTGIRSVPSTRDERQCLSPKFETFRTKHSIIG